MNLRRDPPWMAVLLILFLAHGAGADAPLELVLQQGTLTYTVVHKLHEVKGVSHAVEGRAQVLPDGTARVHVRAKVASFDSGNSNRDEHMREATHDVDHPFAIVKGTLTGMKLPLAAPAEKTLDAVVELNGEKQTVSFPIKLTPESDRVRGQFSFTLSLEGFKIERPSLLFVKVDDKLQLEGNLVFGGTK